MLNPLTTGHVLTFLVPLLPTESLSNFDVEDSSKVDTQGVAYDYDSIMHYEHLAFSRNGHPTIRPLAVNVLSSRLGQRNGFSRGDLDHINALYCGGIYMLVHV